uniref:DUF4220 domain-containing protein n=1 Tax=Leersia perrieri TaxID=77586 RepID=A0A0D9Y0L0_9ORYZ
MFTRDNRLDYRVFFSTRGAFRPLGWNGLLTVLVYFSVVLVLLLKYYYYAHRGGNSFFMVALIVVMAVFIAIGQVLSSGALKLVRNPLIRSAISLWSPLLAILLMGLCVLNSRAHYNSDFDFECKNSTRWIMYTGLFLPVLVLTISKLQFPCIIKLVESGMSSRQKQYMLAFWRRVILNLCMLAAIVMLLFNFRGIYVKLGIIQHQIFALLLVSFGNLQIPAAVLRVVLAVVRLKSISKDYSNPKENEINLAKSLKIFYGIVLGQGILYTVACLLEVFSFIPRRFLIRRAGFKGKRGVRYVNLYYAYAFEKYMRGAMLAQKKISLVTFAMDSINSSDKSSKKLDGVQVLHIFLTKEEFRAKTIQKLTTSRETMSSLFSMLGWTSDGDEDIRLFAAKVTAEIAGSLRVVRIPGAVQLVASLLDNIDHQPKDHFLLCDSQEATQECPTQEAVIEHNSSQIAKFFTYILIPVDEPTNTSDQQNSSLMSYWKQKTKCWSIPEDEPSTNQDYNLERLVHGLIILERLASFDSENCMEISRSTGLISKMIDFTSDRNDMGTWSLRVLRRLSSTKGKLGVTLRYKILEHPFLLTNLTDILDDSGISSHELMELAAEILKNLAMDRTISEDIKQIRVIISSLMRAFLSRNASTTSTNSSHLLRKISGQALALLAMESSNNCLAMLRESGYEFIKELTTMFHHDLYKFTAASLLGNICDHAQSELSNSDLRELFYILRKVLEGIMGAQGAELEICKVIPENFAQELEHGQIKEIFVQRLVNALNANMKASAHCPGIRRVIVQHAIYLMECNSRYANDFHRCHMVDTLSMVERTPSRAENYRLFSGDTGLMEHVTPLSSLVARAKEIMGHEWLRGISSIT